MSEARVTIIVAVSENGVIGRDLDMPWKLSTDLKRFKAMTMGKPLIMGRKTFLSVGERPLPGRPHIIVSRNADYRPDGVDVVSSLEEALKLAKDKAAKEQYPDKLRIGEWRNRGRSNAANGEDHDVMSQPDDDTLKGHEKSVICRGHDPIRLPKKHGQDKANKARIKMHGERMLGVLELARQNLVETVAPCRKQGEDGA